MSIPTTNTKILGKTTSGSVSDQSLQSGDQDAEESEEIEENEGLGFNLPPHRLNNSREYPCFNLFQCN